MQRLPKNPGDEQEVAPGEQQIQININEDLRDDKGDIAQAQAGNEQCEPDQAQERVPDEEAEAGNVSGEVGEASSSKKDANLEEPNDENLDDNNPVDPLEEDRAPEERELLNDVEDLNESHDETHIPIIIEGIEELEDSDTDDESEGNEAEAVVIAAADNPAGDESSDDEINLPVDVQPPLDIDIINNVQVMEMDSNLNQEIDQPNDDEVQFVQNIEFREDPGQEPVAPRVVVRHLVPRSFPAVGNIPRA